MRYFLPLLLLPLTLLGQGQQMYLNPVYVAASGVCGTQTPTAAGSWSFDEGSGIIANDDGTGGNAGALLGWSAGAAPTWNTTGAVITNCLNFNGTSAYVQIPAAPVAPFPLTMALWFKLANSSPSSGNGFFLMGEGAITSLQDVYFAIVNNSGTTQIYSTSQDATTANSYESYYDLTLDTSWHFAVAVWSAANACQLYIDGVAQNSGHTQVGTPPTNAGMNHTFIGGLVYNTTSFYNPFNGSIDNPQLYPAAWSATTVSNAYQCGLPGVSSPGTGNTP